MKTISLGGQWQMHALGEEAWHVGHVPGTVYGDLIQDGSMADPFYRENEKQAFDLMEKDYEYVRSFAVTKDELASDDIVMVCEGLDTLAHVYINGKEVGYADNMHRTWRWHVQPLLRIGDNDIRILFHSPLKYIAAENEKRPCWGSGDATPGFSHLRKAHCMFGWDWGPRLPDAGIWRAITLFCVKGAYFESVRIDQTHEEGKVALQMTPDLLVSNDKADLKVTYTLTSPGGKTCEADGDGHIDIENPALWWPAGYGPQPLYTLCATLFADGEKVDTWEKRIGLRTLSISREKDQWGEEFCHIVNGVKVFAMGGDYIPEDNLLHRVTPERTRRLLEDAKLANFNTIRIWGGGYYPDDFFFDICDELGLMVWQDFMYACALYDLTEEFEASIIAETVDNLKRLRHHASLALMCGNNEMEMFQEQSIRERCKGNNQAFAPNRTSHYADYIKMFEYILPKLMKEHAPQVYYWPASPSSGGSFDAPNDPNRGDVHYWDVWHGEKPFTEYRKFHFRYASEFGFQSFPCMETIKSFTLPKDRNIFSRVMERHQRNQAANGKILSYLSQTYLYPNSFDMLLYCSQLLQADAIRYGVEHWRRNRGRCMGAIIWQLNDCWPVASWASIDYFGRWKALHYAAKRFFAPVMISACEEGEITQNPKINEFHPDPIRRSVRLNVANETIANVSGKVRWALRKADGEIVRSGESQVDVAVLSSLWLDDMVFEDASLTAHYVSFAFLVDGEEISQGTVLFCAPKHFEFVDPILSCTLEGDEILISAKAYARSVQIESEDPDLLLSDNFFDMNPGTRRIKILRGTAQSLQLRSVYNIGE